jgi:phosphopantetheinyl transferase (holo-ACP synthase)
MLQLVGNDVIDLLDSENIRQGTDSRFLNRVCSETEIKWISQCESISHTALKVWAAKEAAFKVGKKRIRLDLPFSPVQWEVSRDLQTVLFDGHLFYLLMEESVDFIHAISSNTQNFESVKKSIVHLHDVEPIELTAGELESTHSEASIRVRQLAKVLLLKNGVQNPEVLRVKSTSDSRFGPPLIYSMGAPTHTDISLSHDGRFVAVACTCN